jgi:hypothetical protein
MLRDHEVAGSSPVAPITLCERNALRLTTVHPGASFLGRLGRFRVPRTRVGRACCTTGITTILLSLPATGGASRTRRFGRQLVLSLRTLRTPSGGATTAARVLPIIYPIHRYGQPPVPKRHHSTQQPPYLTFLPLDGAAERQPDPQAQPAQHGVDLTAGLLV